MEEIPKVSVTVKESSPMTTVLKDINEQFKNLDMSVPATPLVDYSTIRSKIVLISPTEEQYELLKKRLEERIADCRGECIYEIGIGEGTLEMSFFYLIQSYQLYIFLDGGENGLETDDYQAALATLRSLASTLNAECVELRQRKGEKGATGQYLVRKRVDETDFMEIRVAVVGNVDAGKSTLLGVLTHGELDNGRGFARQRLFRHKHEMESGRTSSVGNDILGFDSIGNVVNKPEHGNLDWVRICEKSAKVITFIDLAGHERYLKTTVFGMTGHAPDFGMLMVSLNHF